MVFVAVLVGDVCAQRVCFEARVLNKKIEFCMQVISAGRSTVTVTVFFSSDMFFQIPGH